MKKYVIEAIGTMVLVLVYGLTKDPLAIGLVLATLIYGGMYVSGGHFNPAVTFAYYIRKDINLKVFLGYTVSQILGSFAASGVLLMVTSSIFLAQPPTASTVSQHIAGEILMSFLLIFSYLSLLNYKGKGTKRIHALGVGLTLTAALLISNPMSGGYLNPVLSIGTSLIDFFAINNKPFSHIPLFTLAPLTGSILAVLLDWYIKD